MGPLAALLLLAAQDPASSPAMAAEVRCVVVSLAIAAVPDFAAAGSVSSLYWIGRVHGRMSEQALEDAIVAEALVMTPADIKLESARCGAELEAEGKRLSAMGASITRRAERMQTR